jgi:riboflavin biosynthesis pyrimidine reductase
MTYWETASIDAGQTEPERDFARIWRAAEKIVYSRTLPAPTTVRTRLERSFDPADVRRLKQSSTSDLSIGGADLAGQALAAGLVDECQVFLSPIAIGGASRSRSVSAYGSSCSTSTALAAARSAFVTRLLPAEKSTI